MPNHWDLRPQGQPWIPPSAPRLVNRGIQGGTFKLDLPDGRWLSVLKLQSKCPDAPSAEGNDHFRTIYVQNLSCTALQRVDEEEFVTRLGILLRFSFGIGNGQMKTFYNLCANTIVHAAITGESVEVDAACVKIFYDEDEEFEACELDEPQPLLASVPPSITIGVIQNQALALNQVQMPRRTVNVATHTDGTTKAIPVPPGAQSVRVLGDPTTVSATQIFTADGSDGIPFEINEETPLAAGVWAVTVASTGGSDVVSVGFGLGV